MKNKEFSINLEGRTKRFAIKIIMLSAMLKYNSESKVIKNQITKSGTSIGANYREANRAKSSADFANKIKICESEANETLFWIELINEMQWLDNSLTEPVYKEGKEILAIFTSIGKSLKNNKT